MGERIRKNNMSGLLVLLVFAAFMVSVLMVLLTGADVVRGLTQRDEHIFEHRTAVQYMATRVRQADCGDMITLRSFGDGDALILAEEIDGAVYETQVYCYDGYLRELFTAADTPQDAEFGEKIISMQSFSAQLEDGFLEMRLTFPDGQEETVCMQLRSGREAKS